MRNIFFVGLIVFFALLSCRSDEDSIQFIDQKFNLYIKNKAGRDLLKKDKNASLYYFSGYSMNDEYGATDNSPVSSSLRMNPDSSFYVEYIAGAKRVGLDTLNPNDKTYHSIITLSLRRTVNNAVIDTIHDKLEIQYHFTPKVFEVSKVYYNDTLRFTKQPGASNVVTIIK